MQGQLSIALSEFVICPNSTAVIFYFLEIAIVPLSIGVFL